MAAYGWRKKASVSEGLFTEGYRFEFLQAVRLLEILFLDCPPVGETSNPAEEALRFSSRIDLGFPPTDLHRIEPPPLGGGQAKMTVNFLGLAGEQGPLPQALTEQLRDRTSARDRAGASFLDLFQHRLIALFYRARKKYRPALTHKPPDQGRAGRSVLALLGLGTPGLGGRMSVRERALLHYAGLLAGRPRTQVGLARLLEDYFHVPVEVKPFVGDWLTLSADQWTRLGKGGQNQVLGESAVLGQRVWDQGAGFELALGPLKLKQLLALLPTGEAYRSLVALARFYVGEELGIRFRLILAREEIPTLGLGRAGDTRLGWSSQLAHRGSRPAQGAERPSAPQPSLGGAGGGRLGWTSWLRTRPGSGDDGQVVLTVRR